MMEAKSASPSIQFLDFPLEIRLMIYGAYFWDLRYPPARIMHEEPPSSLRLHWQPALLTVNKQIEDEITDFFRRQMTSTYRISWQESRFDEFTMSGFRARKEKPDQNIKHFILEIYPPHPDRPTDMLHIWREVEGVRDTIGRYWTTERISIVFRENEIASWSHDGEPRDSMNLYGRSNHNASVSDITLILEILDTLANITEVNIQLPASLDGNEDVYEYCLACEDSMMAPFDGDYISMYQMRDFLTHSIDRVEPRLKDETSRISRAKIDAMCGSDSRKLSQEELHRLKQIWPYTELLDDDRIYQDQTDTGTPSIGWSSNPSAPLYLQDKALALASRVPGWQLPRDVRKTILDWLQDFQKA